MAKKNKIETEERKCEVGNITLTELDVSESSGVDINTPLIKEFYKALKNQKIFGIFSKTKKFNKLSSHQKLRALISKELINIGDLTVIPYGDDFLRRIKIIRATIVNNNYYRNEKWPELSISQYLAAYAKEYFKIKKTPLKHSQLYYQFMFGIINVVIGLFLFFGVIYYFWGKTVLFIILFLVLIYSAYGIYKVYKF